MDQGQGGGGEALSRRVSSSAPQTFPGQLLCLHTVATAWALSQLSLGSSASSLLLSHPPFCSLLFLDAVTTHHPQSIQYVDLLSSNSFGSCATVMAYQCFVLEACGIYFTFGITAILECVDTDHQCCEHPAETQPNET